MTLPAASRRAFLAALATILTAGSEGPVQPQNDEIVGGTALRIPAIQSPNFSAGSTGWIIRADGTAEFNGATFRGNVIIQSNQAILFYSSVPALGNLVGSISPVGGTDTLGNTYPAGFQFIDGTLKSALTVATFQGTLVPLLELFTGAADEDLPFHIKVVASASTGPYVAQIAGPADSGVQDAVGIQLVSGDNASANAFGQAFYDSAFVTGLGTRIFMIKWGVGGVTLSPVASITALQPGTGTGTGNLPAAESWHALSYSNGWSDFGSGYQSGRYRVEPMFGGVVRLDGMIKPGTYTDNTTVFTMPVNYRPTAKHRWVMQADSATTGANMFELDITTGGVVTLQSIQGGTPGFIDLTGLSYPLD